MSSEISDGTQDPAAQASQLFASLFDQPPPPRARSRPASSAAPADAGPGDQDGMALLRSCVKSSNRNGEAIDRIRHQVEDIAKAVGYQGRAIEQALGTIDNRLAALERMLLVHRGPAAEPNMRALERLRLTLEEERRRGEG